MGTILTFETSAAPSRRRQRETPAAGSAEIIIFPGIRIEHYDDDPEMGARRKTAASVHKRPGKGR